MSYLNKNYLNVKGYIWLLFVVLSILFISVPQIDMFVANLFYDGKSFPLNKTPLEGFFYYSVKPLVVGFSILTIIIYLYNKITKKQILNINAKALLYILLTLGIAPGLVVNTTLKENWGRARPAQIKEFGGTKKFTPAFVISNQDGYSFSSGHTAAAFSLIGFALLFRKYKFLMPLILIYATCVSIARMGAGGHFLSDVVTSFFIVWIFTHIFYKLIFKEDS